MRIAVLGAGSHSQQHGEALRLLQDRDPDRICLAAVCDLDRDRADTYRQRYGFKQVYTDWREMLDREHVDGLAAITPLPLTAEIAGQLLPHGIPLLVEKPPGQTVAAARALQAAAVQHNTPHMVSFNRRFAPALARLREWIGECPEQRRPHAVVGRMIRHNRTEPDFATGTAVHLIDAVQSFLGPPTRVRVAAQRTSVAGCRHFSVELEYDHHLHATLVVAPKAGVVAETYEVYGDGWWAQADFWEPRLRIVDNDRETVNWTAEPDIDRASKHGTTAEMNAFLRLVEGNPDPAAATLTDGVNALVTAETIAGTDRTQR